MNMEYNSHREPLIISEYGRHVQSLVEFAVTIEDREQRQLFVEMIVNLMYQIVPSSKQSREVTERLWNHVMRIADYKLDVAVPDDILIVTKEKRQKARKLAYPKTDLKYRNYGYYVQQLIDIAKAEKDDEKRMGYGNVIGSYMKMAARNWGHEQLMNDDVIKNDLRRISGKAIDVPEDVALDYLGDQSNFVKRKKTHKALSTLQNAKKKRSKRKKRF